MSFYFLDTLSLLSLILAAQACPPTLEMTTLLYDTVKQKEMSNYFELFEIFDTLEHRSSKNLRIN